MFALAALHVLLPHEFRHEEPHSLFTPIYRLGADNRHFDIWVMLRVQPHIKQYFTDSPGVTHFDWTISVGIDASCKLVHYREPPVAILVKLILAHYEPIEQVS